MALQTTSTDKIEPQKSVYIGIATGPSKDYANHYMVAALRNLDWQNKEIHWATTHFMNTQSDMYRERLKNLMGTVQWDCSWGIHTTYMDMNKPLMFYNLKQCSDGQAQASSFDMVLKNLRLLRGNFLDGNCDYFLEVGGDNPPPRETIKRLMALDVDVAAGMCYYRNREGNEKEAGQPMAFIYTWTLDELEKFNLEPENMAQFKLAFVNTPMVLPLAYTKDWEKQTLLKPYVGGTGMVLIKRHVLERVGWHLPFSKLFSEDLYFFHQCNMHGYSTACDAKFHVPHFHEDGLIF